MPRLASLLLYTARCSGDMREYTSAHAASRPASCSRILQTRQRPAASTLERQPAHSRHQTSRVRMHRVESPSLSAAFAVAAPDRPSTSAMRARGMLPASSCSVSISSVVHGLWAEPLRVNGRTPPRTPHAASCGPADACR